MQVEVYDGAGRPLAIVVSIDELALVREPLGIICGVGIGHDGSSVRWRFTPEELALILGNAVALDPYNPGGTA